MSAEWQVQGAESWKVTLPCTRAEAEAIAAAEDPLPGLSPPPVLMTSEPDPDRPEVWQIDLYCEGVPTPELVARLHALVPSAAAATPVIAAIAEEDWVTRSQAWLTPIRAGRFYVHTAAHAGTAPAGAVAFHIEAGRAFGTGHHETTSGCLEMLDRLAEAGARFNHVADIGTGTGLLALAARQLWPAAAVLASDFDPVAIEVTRVNLAANGVGEAALTLAVADGVDDAAIRAHAPFDLVIANILAGPLIALAADFASVTAPGGIVLLAGLLAGQEAEVVAAYEEAGFVPSDRLQRGSWPAVAMRRGAAQAPDRT